MTRALASLRRNQPQIVQMRQEVRRERYGRWVCGDGHPRRTRATAEGAASAVAGAEELSEAERILQEVVALREKLDAYALQPGWTLLRFEQHELVAWNSPKPLPARYEGEYWYRIDEKGQAFEGVFYVVAPELGRVLTGYHLNGESVSVWHGSRHPQPPYNPKLQLYLEDTLRGLIESGRDFEIAAREAVLSERPVWAIEMKFPYSVEARAFAPGFELPVWGVHEVVCLDPGSGMILRYEHSYILEDGSAVPTGTLATREIVANHRPPDEVLEVLRRASMGEDVR